MSPPSWPAAIFDAPLLRGIDARGRRELIAAGELRSFEAGEEVLRAGERGDAMFVVGAGEVALRGDRGRRRARPGDTLGEEASIGGAYRATATMAEAGVVAVFPVAMLRRALTRAGAELFAERLERRLQRRATDDLLRPLVPEAGERTALLDAATHRRFERGEALFEAGDAPVHLFLVVDGTVELHEGGRVVGHAIPGQTVGGAAVAEASPHAATARAGGPLRVVAFGASAARPLARREASWSASPVPFADLHRLRVARSALAIDRDHCVGCGHCAWTCRSLHGVARLVRRGPVLEVPLVDEPAATSLHLVQACQHCVRAPCMDDCPTGAIERLAGGEVRIRDALCTGCGACVKACPWDNVQLETRPLGAPSPEGDFPLLATKCDLCVGRAGPACVEACPTGAMIRVEPSASVPLVDAEARVPVPPRGEAGLRVAPAATLAVAAAALAYAPVAEWRPHVGPGLVAGWVAALAFLGLGAYGAVKRLRRRGAGRADPNQRTSRVRPALRLHLILGVVAVGAGLLHAHGGGGASAGTALGWASLACVLAGVVAAAAYAWLPPRLARMSERALLPDDREAARAALEDVAYAGVSRRSDVFKALFERVLVPYLRQPGGWLGWALVGRSAAAERARVRATIDRILPEGPRDDLDGLDDLIAAVVEARAAAAQRWLGGALRASWAVHAVTAALALALLLLHLVEVIA